jgi:hypothetical protein
MDTTPEPQKTGKGMGFAPLIMGIITWAIYAAILAAFAILATLAARGSADANALGEMLSFAGIPLVCIAVVANAVGVALSIVGLRRPTDGLERRRLRISLALNAIPPLAYCAWGLVSSILAVSANMGG